jgi:ADP-dependent NAD(P)H-hydrate dehydratase / NAD(P)H-hydrate epimerase
VVLAGRGTNGADGRVAAAVLVRWGVRVEVVDCEPDVGGTLSVESAERLAALIADADLVIDAVFGTGFRGTFYGPEVGDTPVLAVDLPSGVDALTGRVPGRPVPATRTVTFVAAKPGLLLWPAARYVGVLETVDIGVDPGTVDRWWLDDDDVTSGWPRRSAQAHKWQSAVWVIGGGPGMTGAPNLAALAAGRAGAGYVMLSIPGDDDSMTGGAGGPIESVRRVLEPDWSVSVGAEVGRVRALVLGPGLPVRWADEVRSVVRSWPGPLVLDASAIDAVGAEPELLRSRSIPAVLTPHAGEFERLAQRVDEPMNHRDPALDPIVSAEDMAERTGAVVVLKGPTTVVADPNGSTWVSTTGDARLATAGTGDVLAGLIGAALAQGLAPGPAAALAVHLHGQAARRGHRVGLMAGDLPELVAQVLAGCCESS